MHNDYLLLLPHMPYWSLTQIRKSCTQESLPFQWRELKAHIFLLKKCLWWRLFIVHWCFIAMNSYTLVVHSQVPEIGSYSHNSACSGHLIKAPSILYWILILYYIVIFMKVCRYVGMYSQIRHHKLCINDYPHWII